jgi:hypothetical protein
MTQTEGDKMNNTEDFLAHYGKLGMKWGRRSGTSVSSDYTSVSPLRKQSYKSLSNAELKTAISRMQLEKQYKDLNPKGLSRANKVALGILATGATINTAMAFKDTAAGKAVVQGIKSGSKIVIEAVKKVVTKG